MRYRFVQDARLPGTLHVVTVRSQRASAALAGIELRGIPEGVTVVTARDIPGSSDMEYSGRRMPVLAGATVGYVGEPVALVAALDLELAQVAASEIVLTYADLAPDTGFVQAGEPLTETIMRGDPAGILSQAERSVSHHLSTMPRRFAPPAPQEALAAWDGPVLVLRTATAHPFHVRAAVASVLDLPASRVRVIAEPLDGPSGKLLMPSLVAVHAALVAAIANAPARVKYSWREELSVSFRIAGTRASWQAAADPEGKAAAARFRLDIEGGSCDLMAEEAVGRAIDALAGPYRWRALAVEAAYLDGETVPCELPPGSGELEASCARELCADALAAASGLDPAAWRLANLASESATPSAPDAAGRARSARGRAGTREVLEAVAKASDFHRKYAAYEAIRERRAGPGAAGAPMRGVGIALATLCGGFGTAAEHGVKVRLGMGKDRRVTVWTSVPDTGRGNHALFVKVVSEGLGIPPAQVSVAPVDTSVVPSSGPAAASRTAIILVPLLRRACALLKGRMRRAALPLAVESQARQVLEAGDGSSAAGTVAAVEVDAATRLVRCTGIWSVIEAGEILDSARARSVALAGLVRGLGVALFEESEAAVVPVPPASDAWAAPAPAYRIARHGDLGLLSVEFLDKGRQRGRIWPRAVGELSLLGVVPAVAAAVAQATGRQVTRLPVGSPDLASDPGGAT
jgi:CO/xanthine dehydrogenase Mo-binding subunit